MGSDRLRIFVTGASGCIGHYLVERLAEEPDIEVCALVRRPAALQLAAPVRERIRILEGALEAIEPHRAELRQCDMLIHAAAAWHDSPYAEFINVNCMLTLVNSCDPHRCQRIFCFSTASIVDRHGQLNPLAAEHGTAYIRSKHLAFRRLQETRLADRIVMLLPTLVFGGDTTHRYSHASRELLRWRRHLHWLRFVRATGAFHFIHAIDIAAIVACLVRCPPPAQALVLGQPRTTGEDIARAVARAAGKPYRGWLVLTPRLVLALAQVLAATRVAGVQLSPWDRATLASPFFEYDTVAPESFGLRSAFPTMDAILAGVAM